jgi:hypothetical protein
MEWTQVFGLMFGNLVFIVPLWLWNRAESRSDMRHMENQLRANRELIVAIHNEIHQEMKDFHGRLCAIEERNRK